MADLLKDLPATLEINIRSQQVYLHQIGLVGNYRRDTVVILMGVASITKSIATMIKNESGDINADKINKIYNDGAATAAKKSAYARDRGYAGMMFWKFDW